jgi:hypothetical protein
VEVAATARAERPRDEAVFAMLRPLTVSCVQSTTASPASVWAALQAAPRWPEVLHDLAEARLQPDGVLAVGAEIVTRAWPGTAAVDMSYRVSAAEAPRHLVITSETAQFRTRTEYTIEAADGGARLSITGQSEPVRWLHRVSTTLARVPYTQFMTAWLQTRSRALLALAERIEAERS